MNYLDCYLDDKLKIAINDNYFCYIFDKNNPDKLTIEECQKNFIDYYLFDKEKLEFTNGLLNPKKISPKLRFKINERDNFEMQLNLMDDNFINIEKYRSTDKEALSFSYKFLQEKRKLMIETEEKLNEKKIISNDYYQITFNKRAFELKKQSLKGNNENENNDINLFDENSEKDNSKNKGLSLNEESNKKPKKKIEKSKTLFLKCFQKYQKKKYHKVTASFRSKERAL